MQKVFKSFAMQTSYHNSSSQTTSAKWHGPCSEVVQVVESLERCVICLGHKAQQKSCQHGFLGFGALRPRQRPRPEITGLGQCPRPSPKTFVLGPGTLSRKNIVAKRTRLSIKRAIGDAKHTIPLETVSKMNDPKPSGETWAGEAKFIENGRVPNPL